MPLTSDRSEVVGWRSATVAVFPLWLAARLAVALVELLVLRTRVGPSISDRGESRVPDLAGDGYFAVLLHWDSNYFLNIAVNGYFQTPPAPQLAAFFPGYPLTSRGIATVLGTGGDATFSGTVVVAMWLVSTVASFAAAVVLWRLLREYTPRAATLGVLMFAAGPYSIFLYAGYSESLFLAFAIAAWYCGVRSRWVWCGVWCALATATRINGAFLLAALVVMYCVQRRQDGLPVFGRTALWVPLGAVGIVGYFGYLTINTGDLFAWSSAQTVGWHREFNWPWQAFYQTAGRVLLAATPDRQLQYGLDIVAALGLVIALVLWVRGRDWASVVYAGLTLLALTTSSNWLSLARNTLVVFPLVILLAIVLTGARRWVRITSLTAWCALFLLNATLFGFGYWTD